MRDRREPELRREVGGEEASTSIAHAMKRLAEHNVNRVKSLSLNFHIPTYSACEANT